MLQDSKLMFFLLKFDREKILNTFIRSSAMSRANERIENENWRLHILNEIEKAWERKITEKPVFDAHEIKSNVERESPRMSFFIFYGFPKNIHACPI